METRGSRIGNRGWQCREKRVIDRPLAGKTPHKKMDTQNAIILTTVIFVLWGIFLAIIGWCCYLKNKKSILRQQQQQNDVSTASAISESSFEEIALV